MYIRRQFATTILILTTVFIAVGFGFFGANQFSSDALPADVSTLSSGSSDESPALIATSAITPTQTQTVEPTETATPTNTPTAQPTVTHSPTSTPLPTATPAPTTSPTLSPVGTLRITARVALNVRAGPDTSYAVIDPVLNGDELPVLGQNEAGTWLYVRLPNGDLGWVSRRYTDYAAGEPAPVVATPAQ